MPSTLLRLAEHRALSQIELSGKVLDLGGDRKSEYLSHIKGSFEVTVVNLDESAQPDLLHDLEQPLPLRDASYDHVLLINVLEHIYNAKQLLAEAARVVQPHGQIVIIVPFLFPLHPSPRDYWRFGPDALRRLCEEMHLEVKEIRSLGTGVFASRFVLLDRLLPYPFRVVSLLTRPFIRIGDLLWTHLARVLGKKYEPQDYALGFLVRAVKK